MIRILASLCLFFSSLNSYALLNFQPNDIEVVPTGRLLLDAAWYSHSDTTSLGDGTAVRSFRLGAKGQLCPICQYKLSVDFARSNISIRDVTAYFEPTDNLRLTIGNFKPPVSLEFLDSSLLIPFLERSLTNVFVTSRRMGVSVDYSQQMPSSLSTLLSVGVFAEPATKQVSTEVNQGYNASSRLSIAKQFFGQHTLLVGSSLSYTKTDTDSITRYAPRPESAITQTRLIDTGRIEQSKSAMLYNVELAWDLNRFSLQSEYFLNAVHRDNASSLNFNGYYVLASYFLTDDYRPLSRKSHKHSRVKPKCQWGAIEALLRYSHLNLNDSDIQGGVEDNITVGLNYYLNHRMRLMMNIIHAKSIQDQINKRTNIFTIRTQYDFG